MHSNPFGYWFAELSLIVAQMPVHTSTLYSHLKRSTTPHLHDLYNHVHDLILFCTMHSNPFGYWFAWNKTGYAEFFAQLGSCDLSPNRKAQVFHPKHCAEDLQFLQAETTCSDIYRYYFLQSRSQVQKERVYTGGRPPLESTLVLWDDDVVRYSFLSWGDVSKNYLLLCPLLPGHEYVRAWGGGGAAWTTPELKSSGWPGHHWHIYAWDNDIRLYLLLYYILTYMQSSLHSLVVATSNPTD